MGEGRLEVKGYSSGDWYRRIFANRSVRSMAQTVNGDTVGSFDLGQEPVEEGTGEIRKWDGARHVDGGIQRELGTLDKIEDDRVFKTYQGVANITQVKGCFWIEQIESHACSQYRGRKGINEIKTRPRRDEWAGRDRKSPVEWTRRGSDQPALCRDAEPSTWQRKQKKKTRFVPGSINGGRRGNRACLGEIVISAGLLLQQADSARKLFHTFCGLQLESSREQQPNTNHSSPRVADSNSAAAARRLSRAASVTDGTTACNL